MIVIDSYGYSYGTIYEGQFKNNKLHGFGRWMQSDGDCYIGQWKDGMRHGFGKKIKFNGEVEEGLFEEGRWFHS